jgi:hypothetical protein
MTPLARLLSFCLLLAGSLASCSKSAKITFHAQGDDGKPIAGAEISVPVFDHWQSGEGFGQSVYRSEKVRTNAAGEAVFQTSSKRGEMNYVIKCSDYYQGKGKALDAREASFGKWQPWNHTVEIRLRRVLHPIPLYARSVGTDYSGSAGIVLPSMDQPAGFDLQVSDWVAPYGKGQTADLVFQLKGGLKEPFNKIKTERGEFVTGIKPYDATLIVTFSCPQDGIVVQPLDDFRGCELRVPHLAPNDGYEPRLIKHKKRSGDRYSDDMNPDESFFLRLRTQADAQGHITQANYAKITGLFEWDIDGRLRFQYFFNPTPNDRNLEFAWKSNLLKVAKGEEPRRQ